MAIILLTIRECVFVDNLLLFHKLITSNIAAIELTIVKRSRVKFKIEPFSCCFWLLDVVSFFSNNSLLDLKYWEISFKLLSFNKSLIVFS